MIFWDFKIYKIILNLQQKYKYNLTIRNLILKVINFLMRNLIMHLETMIQFQEIMRRFKNNFLMIDN